jgi:cell division protein FtsX
MVDLKQQLIDKIQLTTDKVKLEEIYRLLEIDFDEQEVYMLSAEQKSAVEVAQKQIKNGEFLSDEQANKEVEEWLKRKSTKPQSLDIKQY